MKTLTISAFAIVIFSVSGAAMAGDRIDKRPRPTGTKHVELNAANVQKTLDSELRATFNAASGGSNQLTAQQAIDAGWGFLADHFAEVDVNHDGYVNFSEVQSFFDARSPIVKVQRRQTLQVVE